MIEYEMTKLAFEIRLVQRATDNPHSHSTDQLKTLPQCWGAKKRLSNAAEKNTCESSGLSTHPYQLLMRLNKTHANPVSTMHAQVQNRKTVVQVNYNMIMDV